MDIKIPNFLTPRSPALMAIHYFELVFLFVFYPKFIFNFFFPSNMLMSMKKNSVRQNTSLNDLR